MRFKRIATALSVGAAVAFATSALASHNTPVKAPVFVQFFVRALNQCTSPLPLFTHHGGLPLPACSPVVTASATGPSFGRNGLCEAVGVVLLDPFTKLATDVKLVSVCKDIRSNNDGTGTLANTGYSGNLQVSGTVRISDHFCDFPAGTLNTPCTSIDVPFPVPLPCGTVASPKLGKGTCVAKTRANAIVVGAIVPGHRANIGISQLEIRANGGSDLAFESGIFLK